MTLISWLKGSGCAQRASLLSFTGHITNAVPISVLDLELGGPTTNDYDRIRLVAGPRGSGTLYAGGILNVTALNGYNPEKATTFKLSDAVEIVPAFDAINVPNWDGVWDVEGLYTDGELTFIPHRGAVIVLQ